MQQSAVARALVFGVTVPVQALLVWAPFFFLLFLSLKLDKVLVCPTALGCVGALLWCTCCA
jgi:hypothetical protein